MKINAFLAQRNMTQYRLAKLAGLPNATISDICSGKAKIEKCSAETVFRLAKALDMTMDELYTQLHSSEARAAFETFKSNVCHSLKEKGDLDFIIDTLREDEVRKYWERKWYPEAYYTLAMLDYLSRENDLPLCSNYESIRHTALKKPVFPRDIELAARIDPSLDVRAQAISESIPEFIRFNIVEKDVRNVC